MLIISELTVKTFWTRKKTFKKIAGADTFN